MFSRIPQLFSPKVIHTTATMDFYEKLATRQQLRVNLCSAAVIIVAALGTLPVMQGPGPLLTTLAQHFPNAFGGLYQMVQAPMSGAEALGILIILGLFYGVCCAEWLIMWHIKQQLKPLDATGQEREMFDALAEANHPTAKYLAQVRAVRTVRVGDWKVAYRLSISMPIPKQ